MALTNTILIKNNGRVHDPDCRKTLSKGAGDEVRWIPAGGGGPWTVVFSSSPFANNSFPVAAGGTSSGAPVNGTPGTSYKYQVVPTAGGPPTDDPDILIEA